jgi:hypothetical protein
MKTLQELAEAYVQREDLHTEDGAYTKTTIINAFNDGAKAMLQVVGWSLVSNNAQKTKSHTEEDREWLIGQINNKV